MTIAAISAISFVLGATVAYVASRYPGHREVIDAVGAVFLIGWALLSSLFFGRGTGNRPRNLRCDARHSGPVRPLLIVNSRLGLRCVMVTRNAYPVRERIYPLALLFVGMTATLGGIGLLGYGLLALMGY
ncbi:MAG TPA: hypothetical protein VN362_07665 [Xanthobacteraceae bacterium]|nr:hypothetical protein [Xanthobacteraceae bacterium]